MPRYLAGVAPPPLHPGEGLGIQSARGLSGHPVNIGGSLGSPGNDHPRFDSV